MIWIHFHSFTILHTPSQIFSLIQTHSHSFKLTHTHSFTMIAIPFTIKFIHNNSHSLTIVSIHSQSFTFFTFTHLFTLITPIDLLGCNCWRLRIWASNSIALYSWKDSVSYPIYISNWIFWFRIKNQSRPAVCW